MTALFGLTVADGVVIAADTLRVDVHTGAPEAKPVCKIHEVGPGVRLMIEGLVAVTERALMSLRAHSSSLTLDQALTWIRANGKQIFQAYTLHDPRTAAAYPRAIITLAGISAGGPRIYRLPLHDEAEDEFTPNMIFVAPPMEDEDAFFPDAQAKLNQRRTSVRFSSTQLVFDVMEAAAKRVPSKVGLPVDMSFITQHGVRDLHLEQRPSETDEQLAVCWNSQGLATCF